MATVISVTSQASSSATTYEMNLILIKGFPLKAKSFRNTATYQKFKGGSIPPSPLYHGGGMRVRPRVKFQ